MIDREARDKVIEAFEDFLDDRITAFEFDDRLQDIGSDDQTVNEVIRVAWSHYDDCTDHKVCLSKAEWDFFQRLLLILRSDAELLRSCVEAKLWSWDHAVAWCACAGFVGMALMIGWDWRVFPMIVLFGILSLAISRYRQRRGRKAESNEMACLPFESFSQIRRLLRQIPAFQKQRYRRELATRAIRSSAMDGFNRVLSYGCWMLLSPVALLIQGFPSRMDARLRVINR